MNSRRAAAAIAIACAIFLFAYFRTYSGEAPVPETLLQFQRVVWSVMQWSVIVAILGFARHWAPSDSPALRYLSVAVFPVYILHQTVIVVLAYNLKPLAIAPLVEGPLLIVATFAICFAGYELVRRITLLRPLFGLKRLMPHQRENNPRPLGSP